MLRWGWSAKISVSLQGTQIVCVHSRHKTVSPLLLDEVPVGLIFYLNFRVPSRYSNCLCALPTPLLLDEVPVGLIFFFFHTTPERSSCIVLLWPGKACNTCCVSANSIFRNIFHSNRSVTSRSVIENKWAVFFSAEGEMIPHPLCTSWAKMLRHCGSDAFPEDTADVWHRNPLLSVMWDPCPVLQSWSQGNVRLSTHHPRLGPLSQCQFLPTVFASHNSSFVGQKRMFILCLWNKNSIRRLHRMESI